jgi:hypothetical protein
LVARGSLAESRAAPFEPVPEASACIGAVRPVNRQRLVQLAEILVESIEVATSIVGHECPGGFEELLVEVERAVHGPPVEDNLGHPESLSERSRRDDSLELTCLPQERTPGPRRRLFWRFEGRF